MVRFGWEVNSMCCPVAMFAGTSSQRGFGWTVCSRVVCGRQGRFSWAREVASSRRSTGSSSSMRAAAFAAACTAKLAPSIRLL